MATYYISNHGSDVYPFDVPSTATSSVKGLVDSTGVLRDGDVVEFVEGTIDCSETIDSALVSAAVDWKSYDGNIDMPKILISVSGTSPFYFASDANNINIDGLWIYQQDSDSPAAAESAKYMINFLGDNISNCSIKNCRLSWVANSRQNVYGIRVAAAAAITNLKIENNTFFNVYADANGLMLIAPGTDLSHLKIKNNTIKMENAPGAGIGIVCDNFQFNNEVVNNIILSADVGIKCTNVSATELNYNNVYGSSASNYSFAGASSLSTAGTYSLSQDPGFYNTTNSHGLRLENWSPCRGRGKDYEDMGASIVITTSNGSKIIPDTKRYYNTVDSVVFNFINTGTAIDFAVAELNLLFSVIDFCGGEFDDSWNSMTRNRNNQYSWAFLSAVGAPDTEFPFTKDSHFYGEDLTYVIRNRKYLIPFEGYFLSTGDIQNITCPPNPGRGRLSNPKYIDYTTGLFGYQRKDYENSCRTTGTYDAGGL